MEAGQFPLESSSWFAREVNEQLDEVERMQRGVELAVKIVDGCDHAGVTVLTKAGVQTDAATSDVVWGGDNLQYELDEGPCLDSVATEGTVVSNDVAGDRRWPRWGPTVAQRYNVQSMLSLLLYVDQEGSHRKLGALNLYGEGLHRYDGDSLAVAQSLASHLAVALAASREIEQRGRAMITRTVIGQAEGILMERYKIDAERAFGYLRRISQDSNQKLTSVAEELVRTRQLPDTPSSHD